VPDNPPGASKLSLGDVWDWGKDVLFGGDDNGGGAVGGRIRSAINPPPSGSSFFPTDPDGSVDWEGVFGMEQTDVTPGQTIGGCQVTLPVQVKQRFAAPRGYVVVYPDDPSGRTGQPIAMLKEVAKKCKLWHQPARPPIKASDWRCLKKANSVVNKLDTVAKMANRVTGRADLRRTRGKR